MAHNRNQLYSKFRTNKILCHRRPESWQPCSDQTVIATDTVVALRWLPVVPAHTLIVVFQQQMSAACSILPVGFDVSTERWLGVYYSLLYVLCLQLISQTGSSSQNCCQIICTTPVWWNVIKQCMFFLPVANFNTTVTSSFVYWDSLGKLNVCVSVNWKELGGVNTPKHQ